MNVLKTMLFTFLISINLNAQVYKDSNSKIEERISDLLSRMTLEEKIGQMQQIPIYNFTDEMYESVKLGKIGSFLNAGDLETKAKLQKIAYEESRLGIPLIFGRDVIHGYKTILPIPIGQASTWNTELVKQGAEIAAREAAEDGIHWTFAPMIDISRDPRWGRIAESCGEDPYLTSKLAVAMVNGFQGTDLSSPNSIAACAKHFVGYGAAEGGKDYNTTLIPERELRDIYLKPFQAAVNTGTATLMSAFNDLNGVPASGNNFTLKNILRDEWGFNGFVVSDWDSIIEMIPHGFAKDTSEAALRSANSGVNMEMASPSYSKYLADHVRNGNVDSLWVDELVAGILRIKFKLGLFENPYTRYSEKEKTLSNEHKEISKQTAIESIVMLQNNNDLLPLDPDIKSIAIIGPLANAPLDQLGTWNVDGKEENTITPLVAIKNEFGSSIKINYANGMEDPRSKNADAFDEAIEAVKNSEVALLFLGEDYLLSGETHSRAFINLPGVQENLIKELSVIGKPIVLVIMAGRALTFSNVINDVNSILYAWHPGTMGGPALTDIIFGKVSPSGKLPITFPRTVGQIPLYYNHKNTGRPPAPDQMAKELGTPENPKGFASYYLDVNFTPAYEFGFGMSYSKFQYSDLQISADTIGMSETLNIDITLSNTGSFEGKEIVQLYIRDLFGSVTRPVKELKGFKKISLSPGQTEIVKFSLTSEDLKFHDINMEYRSEPGEFELFVGSSSNDRNLLKTKFNLR